MILVVRFDIDAALVDAPDFIVKILRAIKNNSVTCL